MSVTADFWRKCSSCKKPISFRTKFWVCNVSTCNRKRTGLVFCSVSCWDAHVPLMNHRDSWAEERTSPTQAEWEREVAEINTPASEPKGSHAKAPTSLSRFIEEKTMDTSETNTNSNTGNESEGGSEVLVVASKLKNYIKGKSGMNTSGAVMEALSGKIRQMCDMAVENAKRDGRKTVMDRDFV